ncbi:Polyamine N-acetyltransferase 1 [Erysiphe neolycopersici]|uniref:Polyamine N-acetyltransferase 1 n=1 Tax=Erysiphe neolycopersici TaxID=212602 RepID=A0A420HPC8_9PEZI|nr:Polyamine N-acetyltransferase 1 [Erysiphe neolycopersici]
MSSNSNGENLQLILASTHSNTMAQSSPNSSNLSSQNIEKWGCSDPSYLSTFLSWQPNIMIPPRPEESRLKNLHPYTRLLTPSDLDSCVILEAVAYDNPLNCASREKLIYRLSKCGELCQGLFCTVEPGSGFQAETFATSKPVETGRLNGARSVLLGYITATKTNDSLASLNSMGFPDDWRSKNPVPSKIGHQENGRNIVIHSVAVLPEFRSRGIGKILVKSLMQQVYGSKISDRISLITHQDKVAWYEKMDFRDLGPSSIEFGSGGWYDMVHKIGQPRFNLGGRLNLRFYSFLYSFDTHVEDDDLEVVTETKPEAEA